MDWLVMLLTKTSLLKKNLDYNLLRASMVIIFLLFGYQKWFLYEAKVLIPYIGMYDGYTRINRRTQLAKVSVD